LFKYAKVQNTLSLHMLIIDSNIEVPRLLHYKAILLFNQYHKLSKIKAARALIKEATPIVIRI
jgi:hypothetical protein